MGCRSKSRPRPAASVLAAILVLPGSLGVLVTMTGCGEQDLYKPPVSPYQIVSVVPLPSDAQDVSVLGHAAHVACGQAGLVSVDISDPRNPVVLSTIDTKKFAESIVAASTPFQGGVIDIAFVVEGTEGITTYNVTDPDSVYSFQQGTTAVDGNGLFLALPENPGEPYIVYLAENWKGLRIFESDPTIPGLLRYNGVFAYGRGYAKAVSVEDGFAYVADDQMGVTVFDVRVRVLGVMKAVAGCDTPGEAWGIDVVDGYVYVADGYNGLVIMEARGEEDPVIVGHYLEILGRCRDVEVRDGKAFVAAQDGGVHILDVSDPSRPVLLGTVVTPYAMGVSLAASGIVAVADRVEGLVLLGGPGPFRDVTPPAEVGDLAAVPVDSTTIRLEWHAPGDDLLTGTANEYDIRHSTETITGENWASAAALDGEPAPGHSGSAESFLATGLSPGTEYFFALRTADEAGNWSALSNVAAAVTPVGNVPPALSNGMVSPLAGAPGTSFVFEITYTDADGDEPAEATVVVSGASHAMELAGGDIEEGALYRYETTLEKGSYDHHFRFDDGHGHAVETQPSSGPYVGEVFQMGSPASEPGRDADETLHTVVLTREFWISDHEVTQSEYENLMGENPSRFQGENLPVERVTWLDAARYCNARSDAEGYSRAYTIEGDAVTWDPEADGYRLPTEAEWEYACRAGTQTAFAGGPITEETCALDPVLDAAGWYCGNSEESTHPVMSKEPNPWGYYDMHGNVWEWCWDVYVEDLGGGVAVDPSGPAAGAQRTIRGGSWYYYARDCRSASRAPYWSNSGDDIVGFRVARTLP